MSEDSQVTTTTLVVDTTTTQTVDIVVADTQTDETSTALVAEKMLKVLEANPEQWLSSLSIAKALGITDRSNNEYAKKKIIFAGAYLRRNNHPIASSRKGYMFTSVSAHLRNTIAMQRRKIHGMNVTLKKLLVMETEAHIDEAKAVVKQAVLQGIQ
jgi:hypothetical protein